MNPLIMMTEDKGKRKSTARKQWPLNRVTEWCLSLRQGRALSFFFFFSLRQAVLRTTLLSFHTQTERVCECVA